MWGIGKERWKLLRRKGQKKLSFGVFWNLVGWMFGYCFTDRWLNLLDVWDIWLIRCLDIKLFERSTSFKPSMRMLQSAISYYRLAALKNFTDVGILH